MSKFNIALSAVGGAFKDLYSRRLGALALLCLFAAFAGTVSAAWAALHFLTPMLPNATGSMSYVTDALHWVVSAGFVIMAVALAPAVSMIVGGSLFDVVASRVEEAIGAPPGKPIAALSGFLNGLRIGLPALLLNLLALPLLFVPVINLIVFFWLNGYLMGREYGSLAAMRHTDWKGARAFRRSAPLSLFFIGFVCSLIPFVAPLIGASAMTRFVNAIGVAKPAET